MLPLYNLLSFIALLIYFPWLLLKKGPENRMVFLSERLGVSGYTNTDIWVHAVSVGEVLACLPFLKKLKKEFPAMSVVLSTTTYTGQHIAQKRFPEADRIMYVPVDTGLCITRAVKMLRPKIFITVETELWPMLFRALKNTGSRIIILNGRISKESFSGYKKIKFFMKKVLANVDFLYMQGQGDAERIISLGADRHKVGIMGNFKFDIEFDTSNPLNWLENINGKILLAASTHKGEEEIVLDAYEKIIARNQEQKIHSDLKLIIAPRHPERFNEVAEIIRKRGVRK
jgi:3-deoxy-D-manno-octulosonic-acid transferase